MKKTKGQPNKVSTCFDGSPCAEMMQKIMDERRIGSLCEELMRSLVKKINQDIDKSPITQKKEK